MLTITLAVNGEQIQHVEIVNRGPIDHTSAADHGGLRRYTWRCGVLTGEVHHERRNGATALAHQVLGDVRLTELRETFDGLRNTGTTGGDA